MGVKASRALQSEVRAASGKAEGAFEEHLQAMANRGLIQVWDDYPLKIDLLEIGEHVNVHEILKDQLSDDELQDLIIKRDFVILDSA